MSDFIRTAPHIWLTEENGYRMYWLYCPGCKTLHGIPVGSPNRPNWSFNNNLESPTFEPSLLIFVGEGAKRETLCHSFIRNGQWQFLGDCRHEFAGKTVPLPVIPEDW